jgi:hypothetical protein
MNHTPRTDSQAGWVLDSTAVHPQGFELSPDGAYVSADFARELERENTRLREQLADLANKLIYGRPKN